MLSHLSIANYTIVSSLEMEFHTGMTVITGETGAGKSIMLDALGLCLGDRADPRAVRQGSDRAEIAATFDISGNTAARDWLAGRDLGDGPECLLRRVITAEGRSRAYINGSSTTLTECAELGDLLIDIHGQHAHQSLLRKSVQRALLDEYAGHQKLACEVEQIASDWLRCQRELALLSSAGDEHASRVQLLTYQVEELDALALQEGELEALEREEKQLANAEQILESAHAALALCEEQESGTRRALQLLRGDTHNGRAVNDARELLDSAAIQLGEARSEIQHHIDGVEVDPQRLASVQRRLEVIYDIARKHRVMPEDVATLHQRLVDELAALAGSEERLARLQDDMAVLAERYREQATLLGKQRAAAGKKLAREVRDLLGTLAMAECRFEVALTPRDEAAPHPMGAEDVEFLISTNPGSPAQPLGKIASGGELSRISLAIQVVSAGRGTVPSMVFDEVDVGIGGAVAEVVGRLLRSLADSAQILCVTHLPQVAAQGQHHLQVSKTADKKQVEARLNALQGDAKVEEIARMLGGVKITDQTLAHAREMLESA